MDELVVNNSEKESGKTADMEALWNSLQTDFRSLFSADVYHVWFEDLKPLRANDEMLTLLAPNEFAAIWVRDNYKNLIERRIAQRTGKTMAVTLDFIPENNGSLSSENANSAPAISKLSAKKINAIRKFDEAFLINPRNTFENFVVGPGSQLAHATCIAVSRNPGKAYNPLFLYGATGLGKTHLMHAVAHESLERKPTMKIVYTSTEKFTNEFIRAVQENTLAKFRQSYRKTDMLLIDDIHFLSGKERIQEEFFYTFNELFETQKQIFLCSDRPASEIAKLESRLVSRFQWGFVADIQAPDLETRMAILQKKAQTMQLELPQDVLQLLAGGVCSNVRRLEGALNRVAGYVSLTGHPINVAEAQRLLLDVFQEESRQTVSIEQIQRRVSEHYKLSLSDMLSKKRPANIAFPRQVAMYLSRILTAHSLQRIGSEFGGRDHGTVIHACKAVENMLDQDEEVKKDIEAIQNALN